MVYMAAAMHRAYLQLWAMGTWRTGPSYLLYGSSWVVTVRFASFEVLRAR
jgi:hypothetical protein